MTVTTTAPPDPGLEKDNGQLPRLPIERKANA